MVGDEGGGMVTTEFLVVYHCESIFYGISKRHKVTEVSNNSCQLDDTNGWQAKHNSIGQDNLRKLWPSKLCSNEYNF